MLNERIETNARPTLEQTNLIEILSEQIEGVNAIRAEKRNESFENFDRRGLRLREIFVGEIGERFAQVSIVVVLQRKLSISPIERQRFSLES